MQTQSFENILKEYIKYIEIDLANSLINKTKFSRNVVILNNIKNIFLFALNSLYVESEDFTQRLKKLKNKVSDFQLKADNKIHFNNLLIDLELIKKYIVSNSQFKNTCKEFYNSNIAFTEALTKHINKEEIKDLILQQDDKDDKDDEDDKEKVFVQSLLEFNNALSHLIISFSSKSEIIQNKNFNSAINHLYRATLDNYKIIIRFIMQKINNEGINKSFLSIREQEFLLLGEDLKNKKINFYNPESKKHENINLIQAYKKLYEILDDCIK
ncbi:hypothetical protein L8V92_08315 [Campylobacter lari]|nr:hypothetical protein [Campylobacter lari]MCV3422410.1 hypothetical protein [Campylobacter lari]